MYQHDARENHRESIKGWYNLASDGAGFLIVPNQDAEDLAAFLQPYMDLMAWDGRAIIENDYERTNEDMRKIS